MSHGPWRHGHEQIFPLPLPTDVSSLSFITSEMGVGGNRARRWTLTQQPPECPPSSEGEGGRRPPSEKGGET
jgi:hypothetical protein